MNTTFGEKIKMARKTMGLTQKQLADMVGAKHNSISDWEKGKNKPDSGTIEALCRALNMTPNYLLGARSEDAFSPSEKQLIAKYRKLDAFGRELIDTILEKTYIYQMGGSDTTVHATPAPIQVEVAASEPIPAPEKQPDAKEAAASAAPEQTADESAQSLSAAAAVTETEVPAPEIPKSQAQEPEAETPAKDISLAITQEIEEPPVPVQHIPKESAQTDLASQTFDPADISLRDPAITEIYDAGPELRVLAYYNKLEPSMFDRFTLDALPDSTMEITVTPENDDADFIVRIHGDSMEPTFYDGDNVLVQETDVVGVGDIGVFFADGECHIKETGAYGLISHNPRYPLIPGTSSIRCVGRVLGKVD